MRSFKMSLGIAIAEIYGSLSTSYLIPASATLTPSSVFYADVFSLVLLTSIGAFLLSLSFHFYIPSIYLDIVTAGQHLYTLANFIYFGLDSDESPLYWSYKCASANGIYRDMMGDICDSLGYENVSVIPLLQNMEAASALERVAQLLGYSSSTARMSIVSCIQSVTGEMGGFLSLQVFVAICVAIGMLAVIGVMLCIDLHGSKLSVACAQQRRWACHTATITASFERRLFKSNSKLVSLQFKLAATGKSTTAAHIRHTVAINEIVVQGWKQDALHKKEKSARERVQVLETVNWEMKERLKLLLAAPTRKSLSLTLAQVPTHHSGAKETQHMVPKMSLSGKGGLEPSMSGLSDVTLMTSHSVLTKSCSLDCSPVQSPALQHVSSSSSVSEVHGKEGKAARAPASSPTCTRLKLRKLNTPSKIPITPPLVTRLRPETVSSPLNRSPPQYRSMTSSPLAATSSLTINGARSPSPAISRLAFTSVAVSSTRSRSVFTVGPGTRTPECVFKGKIKARVSRSTRKVLRESTVDGKENISERTTNGFDWESMDDVE